jgi:protein disulfide-isomerase A1
MQFSLVLALFLGLFAIAFAQEIDEGVLVLTDDNFEATIAAHEFILVEFYAPWCGHCKTLAPEYVKAAASLTAAGSAVKLAKVDATEHKNAGSKYDVKGFPTLKFFRSGVATEFNGGRKADEIVTWLQKKAGPVTTTITTAEELEHMKEGNDAFVVGYFVDAESAAAKSFINAASGNDGFAFAISSTDEVKAALGVEADSVVIIKTFDNKRDEMRALTATTAAAINDFVNANGVPLVQTFSDETSAAIFKSTIQKHTLFFTDPAADHHAPTLAAFAEAAAAYKGKTLVINVPSSQARVAEYFGLTEAQFPACVFADMTNGAMKKYPMTGDVKDAKNVKAFIKKALAGKLTPTLKSEEPTAADTAGPVTILTGKSFADIVLNNTNDVLADDVRGLQGSNSLSPNSLL